MNNLCYNPPDSPQSFKGVKTVAQALARVQRFLDTMTLGGAPARVQLDLPEAQSEALWRATRTDTHEDRDEHADYAASGQQPPELVRLASDQLGPGEHRTCGSGWTGDMWHTRWETWPDKPGFEAQSAAMIAFASEHFGAPPVATCWADRDNPKADEPALSLTLRWQVRWKDPATGAPKPSHWDGEGNTLWLFVGKKPQFTLDVAFPFDEVDAESAAFIFQVEKSLGAKLRDKRVQIRHGDPERNVWGFWLTSFDRARWLS